MAQVILHFVFITTFSPEDNHREIHEIRERKITIMLSSRISCRSRLVCLDCAGKAKRRRRFQNGIQTQRRPPQNDV